MNPYPHIPDADWWRLVTDVSHATGHPRAGTEERTRLYVLAYHERYGYWLAPDVAYRSLTGQQCRPALRAAA